MAVQLPPAAMQAIQQSGVQGNNLTAILAQLAEMSPEEVSSALAQLGINIDPDALEKAASDWVDNAAEKSTGSDAAQTAPPNAQPQADDEAAEPVADDEAAEGEQGPASPASASSSAPADNEEAMNAYAQGGGGGDVSASSTGGGGGGSPSGGGTNLAAIRQRMMAARQAPPIDDIISAAMAQQATGDANAPIPDARAFKGPQRPQLPHSPSATASADPRMRNMIGNIYRSIAMQNAGADRVAAPTAAIRRNARPSSR